ncbi:MAG: peptidylprolyl isomerase [Bacillota bacterium]
MESGFQNTTTQDSDLTPKSKSSKPSYLIILTVLLLLIPTILLLVNYVNRDGQIVAEVNGEKITREELYQAMLAKNGKDILDHIILKRLVMQEGKKQGIVVSEDEITAEVNLLIDESFYGMKEMFQQALRDYDLTEEKVREDLMVELLLRKIAENQIDITEEDAKEYFAANIAHFNEPEQIEARHILVDTREKAEEVIQQLQNSKDFAELAKEYSKDTYSAMRGGNLGYFERGKMVPEFDEVAFNLEKGQRSDIVQTMFGFHIIEVLDRRKAREVTYEEVRDKVRERMTKELLSQKMSEQIDLLWESANIEYRL